MPIRHQTECVQTHRIPEAMCWMLLVLSRAEVLNMFSNARARAQSVWSQPVHSSTHHATHSFLSQHPVCTSRRVPIHGINFATSRSNDWKEWYAKYTGCPRRNVKYFGRVFLMLNYTDITQNTYIQSWTFTEIIAREVWNFDSFDFASNDAFLGTYPRR